MRIHTTILISLALGAMLGGCQRLGLSRNLVGEIDPTRHTVNGRWSFDGNTLQSEAVTDACIAVPVVPYGDYRLTVRFTRVVGQGTVNFVLPVAERQVLLVLGGGPNTQSYGGLEYVDGQGGMNAVPTDHTFELINHRTYVAEVTVRSWGPEARIEVDIDKRPFIRWVGPVSALSLPTEWTLAGGATIGLGADESVVQYRVVNLKMIPGEEIRLD